MSAADVRDEFGLAYGGTSLVLLVVPLLLALLVEGPLLLRSDRWKRERVVPIAVASMGAFMLAAAAASSMWMLALAFAAWGTVGGLATAYAQGRLVDAFPDERERWMTRWTLCGSIGDTVAPLLVVGVATLGFGWRGALACTGVLHLLHALVLARARLPACTSEADSDEHPEESLWARLRAALRDRELMTWLSASALCCLMDEILVVFGTLFLRDELGASPTVLGVAFTVAALGGVIGLVVTERLLLRVDPLRLLVSASVACGVVFIAWLFVRSIPVSIALLGLVGVACAPLYPICAARAYAARPGQPGLVAAVDQVFAWLPVVAPLVLGLIADRWGVVVGLAVLALQPIGVGLVATLQRPRLHNSVDR